MGTLVEVLAGLAILANAVVYGTDVFGAIVLRPAIAAVDDRTLTKLLGHIHRFADRLAIGAAALIAAVAMTALAGAELALGEHCSRSARDACPRHLPGDSQPSEHARDTALTAAILAHRCRATLAISRPAGTPSSTRASRCRRSLSPRYASRSPQSDHFE